MIYVWNTKNSDRHAKVIGASEILSKCYTWNIENEKQKHGISSLEHRDTGFLPFGNGDHEIFGAGERRDDFSCQKMEAMKKKKN